MTIIFTSALVALVLAVLIALPLVELELAHQVHTNLYAVQSELAQPESVRTNGMGTVFLMMEFARIEEREAANERSFQDLFRYMPAANDGTLEAANG